MVCCPRADESRPGEGTVTLLVPVSLAVPQDLSSGALRALVPTPRPANGHRDRRLPWARRATPSPRAETRRP